MVPAPQPSGPRNTISSLARKPGGTLTVNGCGDGNITVNVSPPLTPGGTRVVFGRPSGPVKVNVSSPLALSGTFTVKAFSGGAPEVTKEEPGPWPSGTITECVTPRSPRNLSHVPGSAPGGTVTVKRSDPSSQLSGISTGGIGFAVHLPGLLVKQTLFTMLHKDRTDQDIDDQIIDLPCVRCCARQQDL